MVLKKYPKRNKNTYDVVASNIPFGDTSVFDLSYSRSKDEAKVQAARSIHNYFFLKGTDMLREGGLLAFITSQGVLNSPLNEPIRRALMQNNNLVSAIRLPNNLFTEYAGTEVGSDLIILQKNSAKQALNWKENRFCETYTSPDNVSVNVFLENPKRVIHTDSKLGTDPYGKPALIYTHKDGVAGIAKDLKQKLSDDFAKYLNIDLYKGHKNEEPIIQITTPAQKPQPINVPASKQESNQGLKQLSIFDLFENVPEKSTAVATPPKRTTQAKRKASKKSHASLDSQGDLFSGVMQ